MVLLGFTSLIQLLVVFVMLEAWSYLRNSIFKIQDITSSYRNIHGSFETFYWSNHPNIYSYDISSGSETPSMCPTPFNLKSYAAQSLEFSNDSIYVLGV